MNKPNHIDSSELAFSLFLEMRGVARPLVEMCTYLGVSSASEDDVSFSSKLQRPFNWHFYNNKKSITNSDWIPGNRTSEKRFNTLLEKLEKYIDECAKNPDRHNVEGLVEVTGRIMHHIQDMSTPSHVVPVYHGPGLSDHYETYIESYSRRITPHLSLSHDHRDGNDRALICITPAEVADAIDLAFNISDVNPLMAHYESSAKATLKFINEESMTLHCNGAKQSYPLTAFWQENIESGRNGESFWLRKLSENFGSFGTLGNNFGKINFTVDDEFFEGSLDGYLRIYKKLLKKTLIDSIVVLEFVARKSEIFTNPAIATQALSWN